MFTVPRARSRTCATIRLEISLRMSNAPLIPQLMCSKASCRTAKSLTSVFDPLQTLAGQCVRQSEAMAFERLLDSLLLGQSVLLADEAAAKVIRRSKLAMTSARIDRFCGCCLLRLLAHAHKIIFEVAHIQLGSPGRSGGEVRGVGSRSGCGLSGGQGSEKGLGSGEGSPDGSSNGSSSGRVAICHSLLQSSV